MPGAIPAACPAARATPSAATPVRLASTPGDILAGTPADIVKKTNLALNKILAMPDVKAKIESFDIEVMPSTPEQMTARVTSDLQSYISALKTAKLDFGS